MDQNTLLKELQSLEQQRQDTVTTLDRIDGAISMCRHLLAKGQKAREEAAKQAEPLIELPAAN